MQWLILKDKDLLPIGSNFRSSNLGAIRGRRIEYMYPVPAELQSLATTILSTNYYFVKYTLYLAFDFFAMGNYPADFFPPTPEAF